MYLGVTATAMPVQDGHIPVLPPSAIPWRWLGLGTSPRPCTAHIIPKVEYEVVLEGEDGRSRVPFRPPDRNAIPAGKPLVAIAAEKKN